MFTFCQNHLTRQLKALPYASNSFVGCSNNGTLGKNGLKSDQLKQESININTSNIIIALNAMNNNKQSPEHNLQSIVKQKKQCNQCIGFYEQSYFSCNWS